MFHHQCRRCEHKWDSTQENPLTCPKCKTWVWAKPVTVHEAHVIVRRAIWRGILPTLQGQICADCEAPATEYDHRNYHYPLQVQAVCHACNLKRGPGLNRLLGRENKPDNSVPGNCTCLRCGHIWLSQVEAPKNCPLCKSPRWNQPRIRQQRKSPTTAKEEDKKHDAN